MTDVRRNYDEDYEEEEDTQEGKFLSFHLNNEDYGIEIRAISEIIGIQKITPLPDLPNFVKGVINLRGKVVPVLDVRLKFGMAPLEYHDRTCVIVVHIEEQEIGLIVDKVDEVIDIPASSIENPPAISRGGRARYIAGMGKMNERVIILLDVSKLLKNDELEALTATQGSVN